MRYVSKTERITALLVLASKIYYRTNMAQGLVLPKSKLWKFINFLRNIFIFGEGRRRHIENYIPFITLIGEDQVNYQGENGWTCLVMEENPLEVAITEVVNYLWDEHGEREHWETEAEMAHPGFSEIMEEAEYDINKYYDPTIVPGHRFHAIYYLKQYLMDNDFPYISDYSPSYTESLFSLLKF